MGQVEEHTFHSWIRLEDGSNQTAIAPANIHNFVDRREVVAGHNRDIDHRAKTGHRLVEDAPLVRMMGTILPYVHAKEMVERNLAGADAVHYLSPGGIMIFAEFGDGKGAQRARHITPQRLRQRGQSKAALGVFGKDPDTRERPEYAIEGRRVGARPLSEVRAG